jgi:hypothetical protein
MSSKKLQVYIVVSYVNDKCRVEGVYASRYAAERKIYREEGLFPSGTVTFHVIKKSVKGAEVWTELQADAHKDSIVRLYN